MSVIVSGPRRVYVVLLFWQRVGRGLDGLRALQPIERVMDARPMAGEPARSLDLCRPVVALRLLRVFWSRLVGLSVLVLDSRP